jgi:histidinol-phosphate/aromatic aminotransferase/cobyric acid decarboxylase-like protein
VLLSRENILIKDLSGKIRNEKQYVRIAIRTAEDNDRLIEAMKNIL